MNTAKFKDSPLGPIPQDWEMKRLGDLCEKIGSGATPLGGASSYCQTGIALIRSQNVVDTRFSFDGLAYINSDQADELANVEVLSKDVLLNITGDSVARVCTVPDSVLPARVNQHVCILRTIAKKCHYLYLAYRLVVEKKRLLAAAFGGGTRNALTKADVEAFTIPCPPLPEQQRIAEALGEVDKLIESLDEQIEKKRLIAKGVAYDLLGMRNDKNEPIRRIPGFKGEWEKKDYKDVFLHHKGKSIGTSEYESSGQFPVIDQGQEAVVAYSDNIDALFHVPDGGAIVFGDHTRIVKYVSKDFIVGADGTQILSGLGCDTQFLYHALRQIEIPNLGYNRHFKFIKNHQYSLPPTLAEQQAIADLLSEQDAAIAVLEAKREKYVRIKEGMMRDLLTGKVRMKGE